MVPDEGDEEGRLGNGDEEECEATSEADADQGLNDDKDRLRARIG